MGERAPVVALTTHGKAGAAATPRERARTLGGDVAVVREELSVLLDELERRRRDLLNVRLQLRRHAAGAALATLALVGAAAGAVWLSVGRRRRRRVGGHADRVRAAISRIVEHPERVTVAPSVAGKLLTAAASAAVASVVSHSMEQAVRRLLGPTGGARAEAEPAGREKGRNAA